MKNDPIIPKPTDAELEILTILWEEGPCTVRFVNDKLNEIRAVGYTTTLKFLQIMTDKGIVTRQVDGRTHVYMANLKKDEVQNKLLERLMETAFGGSAQQLVLQALGNHQASHAELEEIKALIHKMEGGDR
ncbi:MAG: BlaI/MecI/CopY family transcriptional regulator [Bacteroidales bacterium]|nr:BlaI/MecI/CopY family transcriptional regulator [Lentimicrobiaceae bacterium]MDD5694649.1 BlaI/MecI/CopY family transcriptional regulator [Bacteroidales bacterium]